MGKVTNSPLSAGELEAIRERADLHPLYRMPTSMQQCLAWMAKGNTMEFHMGGKYPGWHWPMKGGLRQSYQSWHGQTPLALAKHGWIDYEVRKVGIKEYRITDAGREALEKYAAKERWT